MDEEWRKIPRVPWYYEVSNFGRLRTLARRDRRGWRRKTKILNPANAEFTITFEDGTKKWVALAALVLEAFVGPMPVGCRVARHLNDDRTNNRPENLAWGTDADNVKDAVRNGRSFASYGHLGKPHTEETKILLRKARAGHKTGHKMTPEHRAAILAGYRKKFPEKPPLQAAICGCGCGKMTSPGSVFIHGHSGRLKFREIAKARVGKPRAW